MAKKAHVPDGSPEVVEAEHVHEVASMVQRDLKQASREIRSLIDHAIKGSRERAQLKSVYTSLVATHATAGTLVHPAVAAPAHSPVVPTTHSPIFHHTTTHTVIESRAPGHDATAAHHPPLNRTWPDYVAGWNGPVYNPLTWPSKTGWILREVVRSFEKAVEAGKKGAKQGVVTAWKNKGKAVEGGIYGTFYFPIVGTAIGFIAGALGKGESGESSD